MSRKDSTPVLPREAIHALHRKNYAILNELIGTNSSMINAVDDAGRSLLSYAVNYSDLEMLDWLLEKKPNVNIQDSSGWTPLHFAAQKYAVDMAKKLLDAGAKVDIQDIYGNTPLWRAVFESRGKGDIIKLFLSHGANPVLKNNNEISPVILANTIANFDVKQYF